MVGLYISQIKPSELLLSFRLCTGETVHTVVKLNNNPQDQDATYNTKTKSYRKCACET